MTRRERSAWTTRLATSACCRDDAQLGRALLERARARDAQLERLRERVSAVRLRNDVISERVLGCERAIPSRKRDRLCRHGGLKTGLGFNFGQADLL